MNALRRLLRFIRSAFLLGVAWELSTPVAANDDFPAVLEVDSDPRPGH